MAVATGWPAVGVCYRGGLVLTRGWGCWLRGGLVRYSHRAGRDKWGGRKQKYHRNFIRLFKLIFDCLTSYTGLHSFISKNNQEVRQKILY